MFATNDTNVAALGVLCYCYQCLVCSSLSAKTIRAIASSKLLEGGCSNWSVKLKIIDYTYTMVDQSELEKYTRRVLNYKTTGSYFSTSRYSIYVLKKVHNKI